MDTPKQVTEMVLYAWVGEDELGSGEFGLKQGIVPAGCIPLVACKTGKIDTPDLVTQSSRMVNQSGKPRYLCKFVFSRELLRVTPQ